MNPFGNVSQHGSANATATGGPPVRALPDGMFSIHGYQVAEKYDIKKKIELYKGSVSTVYKCLLSAGKPVIIKTYHKAKMADKHFHKLEREIAAMRALCRDVGKKGVVQLLDTFDDAHGIYLIMECCEGGDLFKRLMLHGGKLPEHWVCVEVIEPLLRVLDRMHGMHIMHRDIKPENIFITAEGQVKLGDFGLAIDWTKELPFSRSGTLDYMAPEVLMNPATHTQESPAVTVPQLQSKNIRPYTSAVDVWAIGCLAYELVCGKPPFEVEDEKQTASLIIYSNNIHFDSSATPAWADFVTQALVKDPRMRPTAAALLRHTWIRCHLERTASTPAAVPFSSIMSYGRVSSTPRTPDGNEAQPTSDRSSMLRASQPAVSTSGVASGRAASACGTVFTAADGSSSISTSNSGAGLSSPAAHKQQTQQRTCTPSNTAQGFRSAAALLSARASHQSPSTPPPQPSAATTSATTPPVTSTGLVYGGLIASAPPSAWSVPPTQASGGFRMNTSVATGSGGSNGALRSLLDAFKSTSMCGSASATDTVNYFLERAAQSAAAGDDTVDPAGGVYRSSSGICNSPLSSANISTSINSNNKTNENGYSLGTVGTAATPGQLLRSAFNFHMPLEQEGVAATSPASASDMNLRKSFHVQIPTSGNERDKYSSAGGSSTAAVVGFKTSIERPLAPSSNRWLSPGMAPASAREPGVAESVLRSYLGNAGLTPEFGRGASSARQLLPQCSMLRGTGVGSGDSSGGVGSGPAGSGPGNISGDAGGYTSPSRIARSGAATTGGLVTNQSGSGSLMSGMARPVGSLSTAGMCGRAASPPQQRPDPSQVSPVAALGHSGVQSASLGKPPRPVPDSPGRALTPAGTPAVAAAAAVTSAAATQTPCSASPRRSLSCGGPQQQQQQQQQQHSAAVGSTSLQHRIGEGEKPQPLSGQGAIPSPNTLQELTRNWGAVVSISVGKLSNLVGNSRRSGSGNSSAFSSPQRLPMGSGKGLDHYGLPPPTPVASGLSPVDYCSPRPVGVLERVKYHLRGGIVGGLGNSNGGGGDIYAPPTGGTLTFMLQQQLLPEAGMLQAPALYDHPHVL